MLEMFVEITSEDQLRETLNEALIRLAKYKGIPLREATSDVDFDEEDRQIVHRTYEKFEVFITDYCIRLFARMGDYASSRRFWEGARPAFRIIHSENWIFVYLGTYVEHGDKGGFQDNIGVSVAKLNHKDEWFTSSHSDKAIERRLRNPG